MAKTVQRRQTTEEEHIISANNLGTFYRFVNKSTANRHRPNTGVIYDDYGNLLTTSLDKANAFNSYFSITSITDNGVVQACQNTKLHSILKSRKKRPLWVTVH